MPLNPVQYSVICLAQYAPFWIPILVHQHAYELILIFKKSEKILTI